MTNYEKQIEKAKARLQALEEKQVQATKADSETMIFLQNTAENLLMRYPVTSHQSMKQGMRKVIKLILREFVTYTDINLSELEKDFNTYARNYRREKNAINDGGDDNE